MDKYNVKIGGTYFVCSSSRYNTSIFKGVLDRSETVPDGVLHLSERVLVRSLHQDGHGERVGALLDEGELVLAKHVLVH